MGRLIEARVMGDDVAGQFSFGLRRIAVLIPRLPGCRGKVRAEEREALRKCAERFANA